MYILYICFIYMYICLHIYTYTYIYISVKPPFCVQNSPLVEDRGQSHEKSSSALDALIQHDKQDQIKNIADHNAPPQTCPTRPCPFGQTSPLRSRRHCSWRQREPFSEGCKSNSAMPLQSRKSELWEIHQSIS